MDCSFAYELPVREGIGVATAVDGDASTLPLLAGVPLDSNRTWVRMTGSCVDCRDCYHHGSAISRHDLEQLRET